MNARHLQSTVREAAQAGRFYEGDPLALRREVENLLDQAPSSEPPMKPLALLVPHAGYIYSGRIAAAAYRTIRDHPPDRVLIMGPSHQSYAHLPGGALPSLPSLRHSAGRDWGGPSRH